MGCARHCLMRTGYTSSMVALIICINNFIPTIFRTIRASARLFQSNPCFNLFLQNDNDQNIKPSQSRLVEVSFSNSVLLERHLANLQNSQLKLLTNKHLADLPQLLSVIDITRPRHRLSNFTIIQILPRMYYSKTQSANLPSISPELTKPGEENKKKLTSQPPIQSRHKNSAHSLLQTLYSRLLTSNIIKHFQDDRPIGIHQTFSQSRTEDVAWVQREGLDVSLCKLRGERLREEDIGTLRLTVCRPGVVVLAFGAEVHC